MAFNQPRPTSLLYKTVNFTTQHGTTAAPWHKKRLTHASGWMALLVGGETHQLEFADSDQVRRTDGRVVCVSLCLFIYVGDKVVLH